MIQSEEQKDNERFCILHYKTPGEGWGTRYSGLTEITVRRGIDFSISCRLFFGTEVFPSIFFGLNQLKVQIPFTILHKAISLIRLILIA